MNIRELSLVSGVAYSRLHDWLSDKGIGTRGPSIANLESVFRALDIHIKASRYKRRRP